jgi:hypothetical protein
MKEAVTLTSCVSTSPGLPQVYLVNIQERTNITQSGFNVRVGYFGKQLGSLRDSPMETNLLKACVLDAQMDFPAPPRTGCQSIGSHQLSTSPQFLLQSFLETCPYYLWHLFFSPISFRLSSHLLEFCLSSQCCRLGLQIVAPRC